MKRKVISVIALIAIVGMCLFVLTGCDEAKNENSLKNEKMENTEVSIKETNTVEVTNNISSEEVSSNEKAEFTKTYLLEDLNVEIKLPESSTSEYDYEDMGHTVLLDITRHETDDFLLHTNDSSAEKIETTTINGYSYEHFKYNNDEDVTYVYRTKANGKYYEFKLTVLGADYDDSQVEKFINTVVYK